MGYDSGVRYCTGCGQNNSNTSEILQQLGQYNNNTNYLLKMSLTQLQPQDYEPQKTFIAGMFANYIYTLCINSHVGFVRLLN